MTIADIGIYCFYVTIYSGFLDFVSPEDVERYSRLLAVYEAVKKHPKVDEWVKKHPRNTISM